MYTYDARYNTIMHIEDDDAFDEKGLLKDGARLRVPMTMQDNATVMSDAHRKRSLDDNALYDLDLSNRWRGGIGALQAGDVVTVNDQQCVVTSYEDDKLILADANPGRISLRDASAAQLTDAESARREAYDLYDAEIQNAWCKGR